MALIIFVYIYIPYGSMTLPKTPAPASNAGFPAAGLPHSDGLRRQRQGLQPRGAAFVHPEAVHRGGHLCQQRRLPRAVGAATCNQNMIFGHQEIAVGWLDVHPFILENHRDRPKCLLWVALMPPLPDGDRVSKCPGSTYVLTVFTMTPASNCLLQFKNPSSMI